jgi:hypothetical protein
MVAAVSSMNSLLASASLTQEHPQILLKRAALYYDEILLVPTSITAAFSGERRYDHARLLEGFIGRKPSAEDLRLFPPTEAFELTPDSADELVSEAFSGLDFSTTYGASFWSAIEDTIDRRATPTSDRFSLQKRATTLGYDLVASAALSSATGVTFEPVTTDLHYQAFGRADTSATPHAQITSCMTELALPDWGSISWEQIHSLRQSAEVAGFRRAVESFSQASKDLDDLRIAERIQTEFVSQLLAFVREHRPSPVAKGVVGLIGNVPLPIPVNPLSVAQALADVYKDWRSRKKYGWVLLLSRLVESL